jgi:outer membrane protein OmpA-like peptidoglycan-associated protein
MRIRLLSGAALAVIAALSAARPARAQTATFAVDRLVMAGAPGDGIAVWRPEVSKETRLFGQLGVGVAANALRVDNYVDDRTVAQKISGQPIAAQVTTYLDVGVEILNRASIQVSFPFVAYQTGSPTNTAAAALPQAAVDLKPIAPGDMHIEGRVIVYRSPARAFKLGLSAAVYLPTGNRYSFAGDGGVGGSFGAAAEYDFGPVLAVLNASYRLRPTSLLNELVVSSEVLYGLGIYVPLRKGTIRLGGELFGGFGASPATRQVNGRARTNIGDLDTTPLEWMLNGRMYFTPRRQVYLGLGAGSRLTGGYAPDFRGVVLVGGSFGVADTDPQGPGSRYVFDTGGVADADHDGVPDDVDACPNEPGELDSDPEKIGCPRYIRRVKGSSEIEVLKRIEFEFDRSKLLPVSFPILDEVVKLLAANPTIREMRIEGHTDNQGTPEYNQKLSDDRADSVMRYLVEKGIARERLVARGFGLTRPRASNDTEEGRAQNRRVEFHITAQGPAPASK